ncbi:hypothetical protein [Kurthia senegalensis]|uniref:hypothetical protein n=1 Tax=Kurthia senegalensis TaxID=1033740 RepID=UPI000287E891
MKEFQHVLRWLQQTVYEPSGLVVTDAQEEQQNAKYAGGDFHFKRKADSFEGRACDTEENRTVRSDVTKK